MDGCLFSERRLAMARFLVESGLTPKLSYGSNRSSIQIAKDVGDTDLANLLEELAKDLPEEPKQAKNFESTNQSQITKACV